jgi:hypothetical protein
MLYRLQKNSASYKRVTRGENMRCSIAGIAQMAELRLATTTENRTGYNDIDI